MPNRFLVGIAGLIALLAAAALILPKGLPALLQAMGFGGAPDATGAAAGKKTPPPVAVRTVRARTGIFEDRVEALGTLRANESVAITAPVTDIISSLHFDDGQRVVAGQILAEMTTSEEKALLEEARSIVSEAKSQFERAEVLAKRQFSPITVLDQRRREFETAEARLKALEARMADRSVRAPFSGVIGLRSISVGALVEPGTQIARLEDDSEMKLDFSVPSTVLATLKPGLSVIARARGYEGQEFRGELASIDNTVDEATRTIRVRAVIPNPDRRLVSGLLMTIDLVQNRRESLTVPEEALVPIGAVVFVFVVPEAGGAVERRKITAGARKPGEVEVTAGLEPGDLVVTEGVMKLRPGVPVTVQSIDEPRIGARGGQAKGDRS